MNEKKIDKARTKILKLINKTKFTPEEIFYLFNTIGIDIGHSLHGKEIKDTEELEHLYYMQPTLALGLILQCLTALTWLDDIQDKKESLDGNTTAKDSAAK